MAIPLKTKAHRWHFAVWKPYLWALMIFAAGTAVTFVGDKLLPYSLPWALVSLIVVGAVATVSGTIPALLVLALSALFSDLIVPDLHISLLLVPGESADALHLRTILFTLCGIAAIWMTQYARNMQASAERRREVVAALQQIVLPSSLADVPGCDVSGLYWPALTEEDVGGDFYDCFAIGDGRYGLMIGDVVGKGKEAAASTALLRYACRSFASLGLEPEQILRRVGAMLEDQKMRFGTATLFLAQYDPRSGVLCYSSAGHEPPTVLGSNGAERRLEAGGPMLGIGIDATFDQDCVELTTGDLLLMVTDGVTEARDSEDAFLEMRGAIEILRGSASPNAASTDAILVRFGDRLSFYLGGRPRDDIAVLLLRKL